MKRNNVVPKNPGGPKHEPKRPTPDPKKPTPRTLEGESEQPPPEIDPGG